MITELLEKYNLKYEDLNTAEKQYLEDLEKNFTVKELTVADIQRFINGSIDALTNELVSYNVPDNFVKYFFTKKRRIHVEARLKNLMMMRDFISSPAKAKETVERMLKTLKESMKK